MILCSARKEEGESNRVDRYDSLLHSLTGDDGDIVLRFFVIFSRFEYALKQSGFVKTGGYDSAMPDWDTFADKISNGLGDDSLDLAFIDARARLFHTPPQKQTVTTRGGSLHWRKNIQGPTESDARYLLRLVRDVRNNLFHGGKYPDGIISDQSLRNKVLLQDCLTVLETCLSLDTEVKRFFEMV